MRSLLKFDQINRLIANLEKSLRTSEYTDGFGIKRFKLRKEDICDSLLDILIMSYVFGNELANTDLDTEVPVNVDKMQRSVYKKIDGKDWQQRVSEHLRDGCTTDDILRIANTESHRNINSGGYDTATDIADNGDIPVILKEWECMMLPTSRDTHVYLDGTRVGLNDAFYTFMGNAAQYPGQFGVPEEDINCMCMVKYVKGSEE